MLHHIDQ